MARGTTLANIKFGTLQASTACRGVRNSSWTHVHTTTRTFYHDCRIQTVFLWSRNGFNDKLQQKTLKINSKQTWFGIQRHIRQSLQHVFVQRQTFVFCPRVSSQLCQQRRRDTVPMRQSIQTIARYRIASTRKRLNSLRIMSRSFARF